MHFFHLLFLLLSDASLVSNYYTLVRIRILALLTLSLLVPLSLNFSSIFVCLFSSSFRRGFVFCYDYKSYIFTDAWKENRESILTTNY